TCARNAGVAADRRPDRSLSGASPGGPMKSLRAALSRFAGLVAGRRADDETRRELQSHLDMETAENVRRGMSLDEARRQARLAAGGLTPGGEGVPPQRGGARSAAT